MGKLYEISERYRNIAALMDDMSEDYATELTSALDEIQVEFEDKAQNIAALIKNIESDVDGYKAEEQRMANRRRAIERRVSALKNYLLINMQSCGISKVAGIIPVAVRNNPPSVDITDIEALRENIEFWKPRKWDESEIDKTAVKEALKAGGIVPGAELIQKQSVRVG